MNCEQCLELISTRLDGELTAQENEALAAHLQECPDCRAVSEQMECLHTALSDLDEVEAPAELSLSVMHTIKEERVAARRRLVRRLSGLAACLLVCVGVLRVTDATYSEQNRPSADSDFTSFARHMEPQPVALNRLDAYSLPVPESPVAPIAHLLNTEDSLDRFLARLPQVDLSEVKKTYHSDFFSANRLLAVVVQEPSSSITHRVIELTDDRVVILRDVPEAGDSAMALWLILAPVEGTGPETILDAELISN